MAASSEAAPQNKRRRDAYLNSGLDLPDAKRANSVTLGYDSDLMAFLEKIDNTDNIEETDAVNEAEGQMMLNGVIKSLEDEIGLKAQTDEIGLKAQTDNDIESTNERGSTNQIGSKTQGELTADGFSEATSVTSDIGGFTYYEDVHRDHDFFSDNISPDEFRFMMENYLDRDSLPDIMYSDTVHGYVENREVSYGSLWDDDIWQLNEHPVIENDFASPEQEAFGMSGAEFHDVWN